VATRDDRRRSVLRRAAQAVACTCLLLLAVPRPVSADIDHTRLRRIATLVENAIQAGRIPGAVVLVGHQGEIVYERAFGARAVDDVVEPMTLDTVFDLASLTKAVATTTSIMVLLEEGRLRLRDPVVAHIPEFASHDKGRITVQHLLTHVSGLRPDLPLEDVFEGEAVAIARTADEIPEAVPGERFIYSDLNFMLLAEIVRRVSGQTLDHFSRDRIFQPLGMRDTLFTPPLALVPRIAPTEACAPLAWPCGGPGASMLRGRVHDPTARRMGGVAGHAGLFSTAGDLARFSLMLLGGGAHDGIRVLAPHSVARMTQVSTPDHLADRRGLGWDIDSRFSSNRGDLFSVGSFGHTGFTGTSLWLDPRSETFVVFLSSRLHPSGQGDVTALRGQVATVVAASLLDAEGDEDEDEDERTAGASASSPVWTGIDVLREEGFSRLYGSRVGLVTNQTGRARDGVSTVDLLHQASSVELVALFSPEHGIRGLLDGPVSSDRDPRTGLPIYSLYGDTRRPPAATLQGLDTIVIDLQGVGARFYTYATTMAYMLEAASAIGARVVVLDRPNPIGGAVEGPTLDEALLGFNGYFPAPVRHGLTLGELARLFNAERGIGADLEVVPARGWRRTTWFDQTGLSWVNPSPNMRNLYQAALYPGIGAIEGANLSVGRGTDSPFEQIGAPWIDGPRLARALNTLALPGVRVYPVRFRPSSSRFAGELCEGVFFVVTDRHRLRPVRLGLEVASALHRLFGDRFELDAVVRLFGSASDVSRLRAGDAARDIAADWATGEEAWRRLAAPYLLYE
jgi:uncharacterized protein YbbC (DUF1343 family)/CubicO group peptidase (beta-lactamase class C family)